MSEAMVDKLIESFDELDQCISVTKRVLAGKENVAEDVLQRVNQYSEIVEKQRSLAAELRGHLALQNWDEVARCVRLINALSTLIRDDAQAILSAALGEDDSEFAQPVEKKLLV